MPGLLLGKSVLITGAASGIGQATALACAREGARGVALADVADGGGRGTAELVRREGCNASIHLADVRQEADVVSMVDAAVTEHGGLDGAFNNAGVGGKVAAIVAYTADDLDEVLDVDLRGVWFCLKHELVHMTARGGAIVNCSSTAGVRAFPPDMPALIAAKHAVEGMSVAAALQHAGQIRVNTVRPGAIRTAGVDAAVAASGPEFEQRAIAMHPMGRLGRPEEVAEAVVWLLSDRASFVTGTSLAVDGGYLAK